MIVTEANPGEGRSPRFAVTTLLPPALQLPWLVVQLAKTKFAEPGRKS